jgi:predicted Rdx family selenoprotein
MTKKIEEAKGLIRSRKAKNGKPYNGKKTKKRQKDNIDPQKTKDCETRPQ